MIIRKTLREQVVEILRHKILSGEIKPGERIIEAKVAEELKVSRGPLREALLHLSPSLHTFQMHKMHSWLLV